ncbi:uncharacterized protein LOC119562747 [Drosophila subpulchrella]|uniref:uncharacterized protein LOC119562747 n=1 Tax=Drosophila subpulchrella TaxID=1486046 RepID=UPI0018A13034|nr:uncharacterized protein LOC119562747 [Drosophila subpulchrella]
MLNTRMRLWIVSLLELAVIVSTSANDKGVSNRIETPGEPIYYLMADAGPLVTPNESLKRTNRSLLKWWDDLFLRNRNFCTSNVVYQSPPLDPTPAVVNNYNGLHLQDLHPFKQMKLCKKLPELFASPNRFGQCAGNFGLLPQLQNSYAAPQSPSFGGDGFGVSPNEGLVKSKQEYNSPGNGDAGYVAPPAPSFGAPAPPAPTYKDLAPPSSPYETSVALSASIYNQPTPIYRQTECTTEKSQECAQTSYPGANPAQIVYQPIIYVSTPLTSKFTTQVETEEQRYTSPTPLSPPISVAKTPLPICQKPSTPPRPSCQTPFRLSLIDQPYRVAPELFEEYNYRLALAS